MRWHTTAILYCLTFCICVHTSLSSQQSSFIIDDRSWKILDSNGQLDLIPNSYIFITEDETVIPEPSLEDQKWTPMSEMEEEVLTKPKRSHFWILIPEIRNTTDKNLSLLFFPGGQEEIESYLYTDSDTREVISGFRKPIHRLPVRYNHYTVPFEIQSGESVAMMHHVVPFLKAPYPVRSYIQTVEKVNTDKKNDWIKNINYSLFITGLLITLLFLLGFALFQFFQRRKYRNIANM